MKKIYPLSFIIFLFSCTPSRFEYVGSKSAPVQKVDVYVDENSISRPYSIVGKGFERPSWRGQANKEKMLEMAIEKAKKNGADAVFFREIFIPAPGTSLNTYSRTDSLGKSIVTNSSTSVNPVYGYWHKEILFLKYR